MNKGIIRIVFMLGFFLIGGIPLRAGEVTGHVREPRQTAASRLTVIVYAESLDNHTPPVPGHFKMAQKEKAFVPHVLAIPTGSKVDFPNLDPVFHNVFTASEPGHFNLGMYRTGEWKSHVFPQPAVYHLFCKIHPQMAAIILVLPTSYITTLDASGNYRLSLPSGRYRLTVWTERTRAVTTEITVSTGPIQVPDLAAE